MDEAAERTDELMRRLRRDNPKDGKPDVVIERFETRGNGDWVLIRKRGLLGHTIPYRVSGLRGHAALWPVVEPAYEAWKATDGLEAA
jgi:hypothetical protein